MNEIQKTAAWIKDERTAIGWSTFRLADEARQFAEKAGDPIKLTQQSISAFEQGTAKRLPSWIQYVRSALAAHSQSFEDAFEKRDNSVEIEQLPTYAGAGGGGTGEGSINTISFSRVIVEEELRAEPRDLLSITIEGNSMEPDFQSGDRVLVDKRKLSLAQPGAFCLWDGDGYVVKYVERIPGADPARVRLISRNSIFSTSERLIEEVRIMGRVVWFARKV